MSDNEGKRNKIKKKILSEKLRQSELTKEFIELWELANFGIREKGKQTQNKDTKDNNDNSQECHINSPT